MRSQWLTVDSDSKTAVSAECRISSAPNPMRLRFRWIVALFAVPLTFLVAQTLLATPDTPATGRWLNDYAEARRESRRLNMPLVVHFSATWCGPCQAMERNTLNTPAVRQVLGREVLGVKLDFDRDRGLADAFRVKMVPADIVVAPDGKILGSHTGQQKTNAYVSALRHWGKQFERPAPQPTAPARPLNPPTQHPAIAAFPSQPSSPMPRPQAVLQPMPLGQPGPASQSPVQPPVAQEPPPLIGLDGYSPVRITAHRQWIRGKREFAAIWEGVVYFLTSEEERRLFISTPHRFAPRMLGCDPVTLTETGRLVQGNIECGAFYDQHLFLFESKESRSRFKLNPDQFLMPARPLRAAAVDGRRLF